MAPSQKRKGDDGPLFLNTQRARKKVVSNLAEKVYKAQLLESPNVDGQKDGFRSKYGSVKTILADAKKILLMQPFTDAQQTHYVPQKNCSWSNESRTQKLLHSLGKATRRLANSS
jgi:hypothetical protein